MSDYEQCRSHWFSLTFRSWRTLYSGLKNCSQLCMPINTTMNTIDLKWPTILMAVVYRVEVSHYVSYGHKLPDKAHSGGRDQNSYLPLASVTSLRTMLILVTWPWISYRHGGPGGGCHPNAGRFFNPAVYRIILLDQRGAGRSKPTAELKVSIHFNIIIVIIASHWDWILNISTCQH